MEARVSTLKHPRRHENGGQATLPLADEGFLAVGVLRRLRSESGTDAEDAKPVPNFPRPRLA